MNSEPKGSEFFFYSAIYASFLAKKLGAFRNSTNIVSILSFESAYYLHKKGRLIFEPRDPAIPLYSTKEIVELMRTNNYEVLNEFSDVIRSIYPRSFSCADGRLSSPVQAAYLHYILDHDGCSQHEITNKRYNSPATVSEVLSYLEKQGLIVRERSKADRRKVCLHLSDSGRDLAMRLREQHYTFFQTCMTDFSEAEQKELFRLLEKFVSNCPPFSKEM